MHGAKLLGPIVAGDFSREREQSLSVASGQNQPPAVAARIASIEFHSACPVIRIHTPVVCTWRRASTLRFRGIPIVRNGAKTAAENASAMLEIYRDECQNAVKNEVRLENFWRALPSRASF